MSRAGFLLMLVCWLLVPPSALAEPRGRIFEAGRLCFTSLDYPCAIELLDAALQEATRDEDRCVILWMLAESHLALGQRERALGLLLNLLALDPEAKAPGPDPSVKLLAALAQARQRKETLSDPGPQPVDPWTWRLSLGAGAGFLFGQDQTHLGTGLQATLGFDHLVVPGWLIGGGFLYGAHPVSESSQALHLAGAWLHTGPRIDLEPFSLDVTGGFGVAWFGVPAEEGKLGLLLHLAFVIWLALDTDWSLGVQLLPSWVITADQGIQTSATLGTGLILAAGF